MPNNSSDLLDALDLIEKDIYINNTNMGYMPEFDCVIHGFITVNQEKWQEIITWLKTKEWDFKNLTFEQDIQKIMIKETYNLATLRVSATELVINKYNLKNYIRGNYLFRIIK